MYFMDEIIDFINKNNSKGKGNNVIFFSRVFYKT